MGEWAREAVEKINREERQKQINREYALLCDSLIKAQAPWLFTDILRSFKKASTVLTDLAVREGRWGAIKIGFRGHDATLRLKLNAHWIEVSGSCFESYRLILDINDSWTQIIDRDTFFLPVERLVERVTTALVDAAT